MKRLEWKATSPICILWTVSMMKMIIITFESTWLNFDLGTMCSLVREQNSFLCEMNKKLIVSHLVTVWHPYLKWHRIIFISWKIVMLVSNTQFECCQRARQKMLAKKNNFIFRRKIVTHSIWRAWTWTILLTSVKYAHNKKLKIKNKDNLTANDWGPKKKLDWSKLYCSFLCFPLIHR